MAFQKAVKEKLYLESPLRNKFQIKHLLNSEVPSFSNNKIAYVIGEDGSEVIEVSLPFVFVPMFEIKCDVEFSQDLFELHSDDLNQLITKVDILQKEKKIFKTLEKYLPESQQKIFVVRLDLTALFIEERGFVLFEHVGAVVIS
jgi:hypothetical protein